jgi:hypothetical protein
VITYPSATDRPIRFAARTRRGVLARLAFVAAAASLLDFELTVGSGWSDLAPAIWIIAFIGLLLLVFAITTEWTISRHELRRRAWLSRPGRAPEPVIELGPQVHFVHETRVLWHLRPNGPALGEQPWEARHLVGAMERAGVRVDDWRGDWARRHRLLDAVGGLALYGGIAGLVVMPVFGWNWSLFRATAEFAASGGVLLGLAIDYLPWSLRVRSARDI